MRDLAALEVVRNGRWPLSVHHPGPCLNLGWQRFRNERGCKMIDTLCERGRQYGGQAKLRTTLELVLQILERCGTPVKLRWRRAWSVKNRTGKRIVPLSDHDGSTVTCRNGSLPAQIKCIFESSRNNGRNYRKFRALRPLFDLGWKALLPPGQVDPVFHCRLPQQYERRDRRRNRRNHEQCCGNPQQGTLTQSSPELPRAVFHTVAQLFCETSGEFSLSRKR